MHPETESPSETADGRHSNRRRFLKSVGAATVGAVAMSGTASAQQYQFDGCRRVCGDTHADLAVVATDEGFECRPITNEVDSDEVPWDWQGYCYEAVPGEVIVGAIEEDVWQGREEFEGWTCDLELNPSDCASRFYESEHQIKTALDGREGCGGCAGMIVSGDGDGISTATPDGNATADDGSGSGNGTATPTETTTPADPESSANDDGATTDAGEDGDGATDGSSGDENADEVERVQSLAGFLRRYVNSQFGI